MLGCIGFGLVDNGVLIGSALLGFSLEDIINNKLARFNIKTRVKGLSSTLLGGGIGNAISDFMGGFCISWTMAFGSFIGCILIVLLITPIIFKIERKTLQIQKGNLI